MIESLLLLAALQQPVASAYIEVTATKIEEDLVRVPASVTVVTAEELQRSGAHDLAGALSRVAGVSVARGSDAGPAGSVPELWGLREADAFLLIVDGVPWGSAFNPPLEALDMENLERVEVLRGSAPVVYGATAFSGVIHVIHRGGDARRVQVSGGSFGSAGASAQFGGFTALAERQRFRDDEAGVDRARVGYHDAWTTSRGVWQFSGDALRLEQSPASPHPREGRVLSPRVALDANQNPAGAHIDETRIHLGATYDASNWITTIALAHTDADILRGFISDIGRGIGNGFTQDRKITELYADTRTVRQINPSLRMIAGADYTGGRAEADSERFSYSLIPAAAPVTGEGELEDTRNFLAAYAQGEWTPSDRFRVDLGARLNHAREHRNEESMNATRGSGFLGASVRVFADTWLFADYRNTFKPALVDFSPNEEEDLLAPETSKSWELGAKGRGGMYFWQASAFLMDIENLVVSQEVGGLPSLTNGGQQRFKGFEAEVHVMPMASVDAFVTFARHDARFRDFVQDFDGVLTQLRGKRVEMSPKSLATAGASFRLGGWTGAFDVAYTGSRWLNKRNTALASGFTALDAAVGYAFGHEEVRLDATNLTNRRDPVAESELGDAQYYRMPARALRVTWSHVF